MAEITYNTTVVMITEHCCNCGVQFGIPKELYNQLRNDPAMWFYCPNGHKQHYSKSLEVQAREEAEKKLREKEDELIRSANRNIELQNELKKVNNKMKRVHRGVCPCCNRTFTNLQRHMKSKHPEHTTLSK
jgi:hypothetical protein